MSTDWTLDVNARAEFERRGGRYAICVWDADADISTGTVVGPFADSHETAIKAGAIRRAADRIENANPQVRVVYVVSAEDPIDSILVAVWG
jgi:hypothetical protein